LTFKKKSKTGVFIEAYKAITILYKKFL
jgi:hypothetical protein